MKTRSFLVTIPRNTDIHYQSVDVSNMDVSANCQQRIDNIVVSIDTTCLYNIRETNYIGSVQINSGYYPLNRLQDLLNDYFTITETSVTAKQDVDLSRAPSVNRILFHTNKPGRVDSGYTLNVSPDITGGFSMIKIHSNIIKDYKVSTSLIDVPIYVSMGLDNVISRNEMGIPCYIPNNSRELKFWMTDIYDDLIELSQPVYINLVVNYE